MKKEVILSVARIVLIGDSVGEFKNLTPACCPDLWGKECRVQWNLHSALGEEEDSILTEPRK